MSGIRRSGSKSRISGFAFRFHGNVRDDRTRDRVRDGDYRLSGAKKKTAPEKECEIGFCRSGGGGFPRLIWKSGEVLLSVSVAVIRRQAKAKRDKDHSLKQ